MLLHALRLVGSVCLVVSVVLGAIAMGIEAARSEEYHRHLGNAEAADAQRPFNAERNRHSADSVQALFSVAIPVFCVGALTCLAAWVMHRSRHSHGGFRYRLLRPAPPIPGQRYVAAKLCVKRGHSRRSREHHSA